MNSFRDSRQAAEYHLYRGERGRAGQAARNASRVEELRRVPAGDTAAVR